MARDVFISYSSKDKIGDRQKQHDLLEWRYELEE